MHAPKVLILYNEPVLPVDHPDADSEHDVLHTAEVIARNLKQAGLTVRRLGVSDDLLAVMAGLKAHAPDLVFNLYEGTAKWGNVEVYVAGILEWLQIPFTGSPTQPLLLCRSKPLTKAVLAGSGLPTARFLTVDSTPCPPHSLGWPVIVKPAAEDGSVGISQGSVVSNQEQLDARIEYVLKTYGGSALVEQFVRGREFHVALLERDGRLDVLPFSEILFHGNEGAGQWPIISFDAKWRPGTKDFEATPAKNPAEVDAELEQRVSDVARKAFRLTGCRDYARVDLRVDDQRNPFILEVNPNPCIAPEGGLEAALISAKIPYQDFVLTLVRSALRRGPRPELADTIRANSEAQTARKPAKTASRSRKPRVRPVKSTDREALVAQVVATEDIPEPEKPAILERIDLLTRRNRPAGSALLTAGEGFVIVECSDPVQGVFSIPCLHVAPASRGQGLGRELFRAAEAFTLKQGGRLAQADVNAGSSATSIRRFLTHHQYLQMADIPDYYKDGTARISFIHYLPGADAAENETA